MVINLVCTLADLEWHDCWKCIMHWTRNNCAHKFQYHTVHVKVHADCSHNVFSKNKQTAQNILHFGSAIIKTSLVKDWN